MGRSCRPFGEQIRFACAAWCWCQGARIAVATCAMPFSTCLKRDANGGALPKAVSYTHLTLPTILRV